MFNLNFALLIFCASFMGLKNPYPEKTPMNNNSSVYIDIEVESNINRLLFEYYLGEGCIYFENHSSPNSAPGISRYSVIVPVKDFKCINRFGYRDFLSLLRADQFPYLEVKIPLDGINFSRAGESVLLKNVNFIVAGVSKDYDINCNIGNGIGNSLKLNGSAKIRLTDFDLEPPVKSLGFIRVKNEIIVNFSFCFRTTESI
jgi:hypothetical protein